MFSSISNFHCVELLKYFIYINIKFKKARAEHVFYFYATKKIKSKEQVISS